MAEKLIEAGDVILGAEESGPSASRDSAARLPVVLLHGLTATRRYVVMGSRALQRIGHRVIAYDARGHGRSSAPAEAGNYRYEDLTGDLRAVLDGFGLERAVLAGASMGAHTLLALALSDPERVAGMVVITPAYEPSSTLAPERLRRWDALSDGLRSGGIEGFLAAHGLPEVPEALQGTVVKVIRQRLALHEHPEAVADALRAVPRSRPFARIEELGSLSTPAVVVASDDQADPEHPRRVGEAYAAAIPGARLISDEPGRSPLAWQGSRISAVIAELAAGL